MRRRLRRGHGQDAPPVHPDPGRQIHPARRGAHRYCAHRPVTGDSPYANICETCDNYITAPEFRGARTDELADTHAVKADADTRGWTDEAELAP